MHKRGEIMHSHVERAVDGTKVIHLLKRDDWSDNVMSYIHRPQHNTNSETIKMNVPEGYVQKDDTNDSGVATVVSMVYVTMSPSFSGSIAGYSTASNTLISTSSTESVAAASTPNTSATPSTSAVQSANILSSTTPVAASSISSAGQVGTPLAQTRQSTTALAAVSSATPVAAANANSNDLTVSQQDSGMSDGAKAGLAIGIIAGLALAAGLIFFCWKRSKKDTDNDETNEKSQINEKRSSFFGASSGPKRQSADSDKSFGTVHTTATAPRLSLRPVTQFLPTFGERRKSGNMLAGPQMSEKSSAWERRGQSENPFADASEKPNNPFDDGDGSKSQHSQKSSWEGSQPSTPSSAQLGTAAAVPVATSPRSPNNVHRVQLDFKPSMEDELELKSGQLVRMLHEYDDGWALCVRMDRSQQGVAPRTCLSQTPVKPRGPPPGGRVSPPNMRGPPPQGPNSPRPLTPNSQQGPVPARKPVPGQAI